jgi:hypothetical protein
MRPIAFGPEVEGDLTLNVRTLRHLILPVEKPDDAWPTREHAAYAPNGPNASIRLQFFGGLVD